MDKFSIFIWSRTTAEKNYRYVCGIMYNMFNSYNKYLNRKQNILMHRGYMSRNILEELTKIKHLKYVQFQWK